MPIKLLTKSQEQDIHCGLTKKIKFHRERLNRWIKDNPEHPDKTNIIWKKTKRIEQLEALKKRFTKPYSYE